MVQIQRNQIVNLGGQLVFVSPLSNLHPPLEMRLLCRIRFVERYDKNFIIYLIRFVLIMLLMYYLFLLLSNGKPLCMDQFRVCVLCHIVCSYLMYHVLITFHLLSSIRLCLELVVCLS